MNDQTRNTRIRIDFVVREVCDDGSVPEDELRFIRFGDDVPASYVKDFFDRTGNAMSLMFRPVGAHVVRFVNVGPNKINTIKVVRELTGLGLKEAKDLVEAPSGTPILIVKEAIELPMVLRRFQECGCNVESRPYHRDDHDKRAAGLPPLVDMLRMA